MRKARKVDKEGKEAVGQQAVVTRSAEQRATSNSLLA